MSSLDERLGKYLRMRRALGYGLRRQEKLLRQFLGFLEGRGETRVTTASALAWTRLPAGGESWRPYRLTAVRGFARYLVSIGEPVEVPAGDLCQIGSPGRSLPLPRRADRGADESRRHARHRAPHRDPAHADRPALEHRDAGRGGDRSRPRGLRRSARGARRPSRQAREVA